MNVVPVKVAKNRYITAIFYKDGLVKIVVHFGNGCPVISVGYTKALEDCATVRQADGNHIVVHLSEAMPCAEYLRRLAKYKLALRSR